MTARDNYPAVTKSVDMLRSAFPGCTVTWVQDVKSGKEWGKRVDDSAGVAPILPEKAQVRRKGRK